MRPRTGTQTDAHTGMHDLWSAQWSRCMWFARTCGSHARPRTQARAPTVLTFDTDVVQNNQRSRPVPQHEHLANNIKSQRTSQYSRWGYCNTNHRRLNFLIFSPRLSMYLARGTHARIRARAHTHTQTNITTPAARRGERDTPTTSKNNHQTTNTTERSDAQHIGCHA